MSTYSGPSRADLSPIELGILGILELDQSPIQLPWCDPVEPYTARMNKDWHEAESKKTYASLFPLMAPEMLEEYLPDKTGEPAMHSSLHKLYDILIHEEDERTRQFEGERVSEPVIQVPQPQELSEVLSEITNHLDTSYNEGSLEKMESPDISISELHLPLEAVECSFELPSLTFPDEELREMAGCFVNLIMTFFRSRHDEIYPITNKSRGILTFDPGGFEIL